MSLAAWIAVVVTLATLVALVLEVAAIEVVMLAGLTLLMALRVAPPEMLLASFGSPAVLTIAALLVVGAGIRRTGLLTAVADRLLGRGNTASALLRMMLPASTLSAFMNNTPIVAIFAPTVLDWCKRNDRAPSRMLMPLSFATILGGTVTLIGTSATLVIDGMMREHGLEGLGMFELTPAAAPVAVVCVLAIALLAGRLLPDRRDPVAKTDQELREFLVEMLVADDSPIAGASIADAGLRNLPGLFLVTVERAGNFLGPVRPDEVLAAGDRLVFAGVASTVVDLRRFPGLTPAPEAHYDPTASHRRDRMFEAVISNRSPLIGTTVKELGFRSRYDAAVLAIHRAGERLASKIGEVELRAGDTLMLEAASNFDTVWSDSSEFALVSRVRAEPPPQPRKAPRAVAVLTLFIIAVTLGWLPLVVAAFLAAGCMVVLRVLTAREARKAVDLPVLLVIGCALGFGRALEHSGGAAALAEPLHELAPLLGPVGILAVIYLATAVLTNLVTNVTAAAVLFSVATTAAEQAQLDPRPFAITVALAASASFMTPTAYQTNLMVYGPGGYRFSDFARLGLPIQLLAMALTLWVVPQIWPL